MYPICIKKRFRLEYLGLVRFVGGANFRIYFVFCRISGATRAYVVEWIPLIAAAQLGAAEDPVRRAMLMKWTYEET